MNSAVGPGETPNKNSIMLPLRYTKILFWFKIVYFNTELEEKIYKHLVYIATNIKQFSYLLCFSNLVILNTHCFIVSNKIKLVLEFKQKVLIYFSIIVKILNIKLKIMFKPQSYNSLIKKVEK